MHVPEEDLELFVLGCQQECRSPFIESHVAGCLTCGEKLAEAARFVGQVKPVGDAGQGRHELWNVRILCALRGRVKLRVPHPVLPAIVVRIRLKNVTAFGKACYCIQIGNAFEVGVQVLQVLPTRHARARNRRPLVFANIST
jgi:hypothetical protein